MPLRNKILASILGLFILNLVREYAFVRPPGVDRFSVSYQPIEFNVHRKGWDYYSSVFNRNNVPVKSVSIILPFILRGTVMGNPSRSFAIIETDGKQELYGLGDMVGGARIVAMNRNRVVLDYNGTKQELGMCEGMREVRPREVNVRGQTSHIGVDFAKLLTQIRIKPYFEGGRCVGFQLSNINNNFIRQMGLQEGDVIESINGVQIDDPLKALQILYSIERNNPVHLGIERGDERMELDCKVEG